MQLFNQFFFKIRHETLEFRQKYRKNLFSTDRQTLISKHFPFGVYRGATPRSH